MQNVTMGNITKFKLERMTFNMYLSDIIIVASTQMTCITLLNNYKN